MSLLLCRQEHVKHPYYVESLGIHLYSFPELSYVICHYPLVVLDGFLGEELFGFLHDELEQGFLALKLERWLKSGEDPDDALVMILEESGYCTPGEIGTFKQQIRALRKKHPAEVLKLRADELFRLKQYGRALKLYEELLEYPSDGFVDNPFRGRIYNNLGSCYARMFHLEKAFDAYEKAYMRMADRRILGQLYQLASMDKKLKLSDRFQSLITDDLCALWDEERSQAEKKAASSEQIGTLESLFRKDSVQRKAGEAQLVKKWKQEYRGMV